jgi:putative transposon-encoded protein
MTTFRLPILNWATLPDTTGNAFFEPFDVKATNDVWKNNVLILNDTATRIGVYGRFTVPKNYVGSARLISVWSTTATSGDVEFDCDYRAVGGDNSESLDQTSNQESVNLNDTAPGAAWRRMECAITLTAGNFAADDEVEFFFARDGTDAGDTIAAAVAVFNLLFEYQDV